MVYTHEMRNDVQRKYLHCVEFSVENIAKLRAFKFTVNSGEVMEITGGNGQCKTTALNLFKANLSGRKLKLPDWLVTDFEDDGSFTSRIDDEITVTRELKSGETAAKLTVMNERNTPLKSPLEVLRNIFGDGVYLDPVDIVNMSAPERVKAIAAALDIDPEKANSLLTEVTGADYKIKRREDIFPALQQAHTEFYNLRHKIGKERDDADKQADGVLDFIPPEWWDAKGAIPPPVQPPALGDIYQRKADIDARNAERERLGRQIAEQENYLRYFGDQCAAKEIKLQEIESEIYNIGPIEDTREIEEQIRLLTARLEAMREHNARCLALEQQKLVAQQSIDMDKPRLDEYQRKLDANKARERELGGVEDTSALQSSIDAHAEQMTAWQEALKVHGERTVRYRQARELRDKAEQLRIQHEELERKVKRIDHLPIELLEGVPVPIPGMVIINDDIFLPDGDTLRNFDAFGDADKDRHAVMIVTELAPVNVVCIDSAESYDEDRRLQLYRYIAEKDFVGLTTRVTKGPIATQIAYLHGPDWDDLSAQSA